MVGHVTGMSQNPKITNLSDASCSIGAKEQSEYLRNEVVELPAFGCVCVLFALYTGRQAPGYATGSDFAPCCFPVVVTTGTSIIQVCSTGTAIEAAVPDEIRIRCNLFQLFSTLQRADHRRLKAVR